MSMGAVDVWAWKATFKRSPIVCHRYYPVCKTLVRPYAALHKYNTKKPSAIKLHSAMNRPVEVELYPHPVVCHLYNIPRRAIRRHHTIAPADAADAMP